jgi:glycerophosphoryl diester phosphodiesterase
MTMMQRAALCLCGRGASCRVIAHRGYSSAFPENTLEAYEQAIALGADFVEIDLRETRDGRIACHHDATTGGTAIASLTVPELAERGIVELAAVLPKLFDRVGLVFDLKLPTIDLAAAALALLSRNAMLPQTVIGVRSLEQAAYVRATAPDSAMLGFLRDAASIPEFFALGGDIARLWEDDVDPDRLANIRRDGHPVWVTAGRTPDGARPGDIDPPRLRRLFECDVDGILVNDPAQAIRMRAALERPMAGA